MSATKARSGTVLVTGANGYIGNAVARAFLRAGWTTYGLVRQESVLSDLAADEIIPLLGSPSDHKFLDALNQRGVVFDVIVSTTEQIRNYVPHYNDIVSLLRTISQTSNKAGVRPLVLFTSGCKDYGMMEKVADSPGLTPHTEESPLNATSYLLDRATNAVKIFEHTDLFDAVVLRPTNVYGLSSSYYGEIFKPAIAGKQKGKLELSEHPKTILHALHVDDCGDAYVAIAQPSKRGVVKGQCYNISSHRFETLEEIANVLVAEYQIEGGVQFLPPPEGRADQDMSRMVLGFSQWTGSQKLRNDIGWSDKRPLFSEGLHQYRLAYEVAKERGYKHRLEK